LAWVIVYADDPFHLIGEFAARSQPTYLAPPSASKQYQLAQLDRLRAAQDVRVYVDWRAVIALAVLLPLTLGEHAIRYRLLREMLRPKIALSS